MLLASHDTSKTVSVTNQRSLKGRTKIQRDCGGMQELTEIGVLGALWLR